MSKESLLVLLGVLIAVTPFSGLPSSWLMFILPVLGVAVVFTGLLLRRERTPLQETSLLSVDATPISV